jgi:hypothetical protein
LFTKGLEAKSKLIQIGALCLIVVFLSRITFHYIQLLQAPDQLREMRWALQEMKTAGLNHGLAHWPYCAILTSLTNQQMLIAQWPGGGKIPDYTNEEFSSPRISVFKTNWDIVNTIIDFQGSKYRLDKVFLKNDNFCLAPYDLMK